MRRRAGTAPKAFRVISYRFLERSKQQPPYFLAFDWRYQVVWQSASRNRAEHNGTGMLMPSVLIIEDDENGRRAIAKLFAREDWKVFEAADGDSGVELALRNRPEVILCDLLMPKSNGFQVCRTIRQQLQPTKIIVVSGRDYQVDRTTALEAGADEYLLKPITWELLCETIDQLLPAIPRQPRATTSAEEIGSV